MQVTESQHSSTVMHSTPSGQPSNPTSVQPSGQLGSPSQHTGPPATPDVEEVVEPLPEALPPEPVVDVPTEPLVLALVAELVLAPSLPPTPLPEEIVASVPPEVDEAPLPPLPASEDSADPPQAHRLPAKHGSNDAKIQVLCQLCHLSVRESRELPRIRRMATSSAATVPQRSSRPSHGHDDGMSIQPDVVAERRHAATTREVNWTNVMVAHASCDTC